MSEINTTSTGQSFTDYVNYCPNRLPCGYCKAMYTICPLNNSIDITWSTNMQDLISHVGYSKEQCGYDK